MVDSLTFCDAAAACLPLGQNRSGQPRPPRQGGWARP